MSEEKEYRLSIARSLVESIEKGDDNEANILVEKMAKFHELSLFRELGKLTREMHDELNNFSFESGSGVLSNSEMIDAKGRLNYVIKLTENSVNKTLNFVEVGLPLAADMKDKSGLIYEKWQVFRRGEMSDDDFKKLGDETNEYLGWSTVQAEKIRENFSHILVSQDFQDLTGQIIRRVINLVQDIEKKMIDLIIISDPRVKKEDFTKNSTVDSKASGPRIPDCDSHGDRVSCQDDVDDLLSRLGF